MKLLLALLLMTASAFANEKVEAGPRKGRLLKFGGTTAEFFVEKDRTVSMALYGAERKQQSPADQTFVVIAEAPGAKKRMELEKKGELFLSKEPLPAGEKYLVVVQAREKPEATPTNFRIKLDLSNCVGCGNAEYACTCEGE